MQHHILNRGTIHLSRTEDKRKADSGTGTPVNGADGFYTSGNCYCPDNHRIFACHDRPSLRFGQHRGRGNHR